MYLSISHPPEFSGESYLRDLTLDAELRDLSRESDPRLFFEGLFHYGVSREQSGDLETAARVYQALEQSEDLQTRARVRLDAILGRGNVGPRAEFLLRHFAAEASDPANLIGMAAAASAFRLAKLATLGRLGLNPLGEAWLGRASVRLFPSLAGFAVEAPTFTLAGRLTHQALGRSQDWSAGALARDLGSSYLALGALRAAGWASASTYDLVRAGGSRSASVWRSLYQQGGTLVGIMLGHRLEQAAGLRPRMDGATTLADSLALLLQFHVGGNLSHQIFGTLGTGRAGEGILRSEALEALARSRVRFDRDTPISPFAMAAMGDGSELGAPNRGAGTSSVFPPDSKPAYSTHRYPPGGEGPRPPRIRYSAELLSHWQRLQAKIREVPYESSPEEILRNRAGFAAAERLWRAQLEDFARSIGGEVSVHGPERLLEPFSPHFLKRDPALLHRARDLAGSDGGVYELTLPYGDVSFGRPNEKGDYASLASLLSEIQENFGKQVFLVYRREGRLHARIPNFALWEGLLVAKFGEQAHRLVFVDGIIPRDSVMRLRGKLLAPVGVTLQAAPIQELKGRVHPFFVPFHDLFHATIASMLPAPLCRTSSELYFSLLGGMMNSSLKQDHLDRLADMDPGSDFTGNNAEEFVLYSLDHFWKTFSREVGEGTMTRHRMMQFPNFLLQYQQVLRQAAQNPTVDAYWRGRFSSRLEEMSQELNKVLRSAVLQR